MYYGSWKIDDALTFCVTTHSAAGAAAPDAAPTYQLYEDETSPAILYGPMATLDSGNTTGLYSEQITLSAANGFEKGKSYNIYIFWEVSEVLFTELHTFQIEAEVDANTVSDSNIATASEVAQQVLKEDFNDMTGDDTHCLLNAVRTIRNKWAWIDANTIRVYKENGSDTAFDLTITKDAAAIPIIGQTPV